MNKLILFFAFFGLNQSIHVFSSYKVTESESSCSSNSSSSSSSSSSKIESEEPIHLLALEKELNINLKNFPVELLPIISHYVGYSEKATYDLRRIVFNIERNLTDQQKLQGVKTTIKNGAKVDDTVIRMAIYSHSQFEPYKEIYPNPEIVRELIKAGLNVKDIKDTDWANFINIAFMRRNHYDYLHNELAKKKLYEIIELLLSNGANPNLISNSYYDQTHHVKQDCPTVLVRAAEIGDVEVFQLLLEKGAKVILNARGYNLRTLDEYIKNNKALEEVYNKFNNEKAVSSSSSST